LGGSFLLETRKYAATTRKAPIQPTISVIIIFKARGTRGTCDTCDTLIPKYLLHLLSLGVEEVKPLVKKCKKELKRRFDEKIKGHKKYVDL
jgi:hypothetical protein